MTDSLFTGKKFPEKVFNAEFDKVLVFEFDMIFRDIFAQKLSEFCLVNKIKLINIKSLDDHYPFNKQVHCTKIENDYIQLLKKTPVKEEFPKELTYYILLSDFIVYSNCSKFALYSNRSFEVGVLAFTNDLNVSMFKELILGVTLDFAFKKMRFNMVSSNKIIKQFEGKEYFF